MRKRELSQFTESEETNVLPSSRQSPTIIHRRLRVRHHRRFRFHEVVSTPLVRHRARVFLVPTLPPSFRAVAN